MNVPTALAAANSDPEAGRPKNPQDPPTTPDGDPARRPGPANEPINPEPEQPPEPIAPTRPEEEEQQP